MPIGPAIGKIRGCFWGNGLSATDFICFDLEATCWEGPRNNGLFSEIIEIGAVRMDAGAVPLDRFQTFVRPTINPMLSGFCMGLTTIQQESVDSAPPFAEAMGTFEKWIVEGDGSSGRRSLLLSWGLYDKNQILAECEAKKYNGIIIDLLNYHHDLKSEYVQITGQKKSGLKKVLRRMGITLEGTHHRGIDDAINIAKVFAALFNDWKEKCLETVANG